MLSKIENPLIVVALENELGNKSINDFDLLISGVGKINAAFRLTDHIHRNKTYDIVVNFGTAGSNYLERGILVDCTKFIQRDMDCTPLGFEIFQTPFEDSELMIDLSTSNLFNPIGRNLTCYTGDTFVSEKLDYDGIFDMEAYGLAKVCENFGVPFISFKYISDGADHNSGKDWEENISSGSDQFFDLVISNL